MALESKVISLFLDDAVALSNALRCFTHGQEIVGSLLDTGCSGRGENIHWTAARTVIADHALHTTCQGDFELTHRYGMRQVRDGL